MHARMHRKPGEPQNQNTETQKGITGLTRAPHAAQEGVGKEGGGPPEAPKQVEPKVVGPAQGSKHLEGAGRPACGPASAAGRLRACGSWAGR